MDYENLITVTVDKNLRTLTVPNNGAVFGVVGDMSVNRICFSVPRYYSCFDMSEFTPRINYANPNGEANYYEADDLKSIEDTVKFTWLLSPDVTAYTGDVKFSLQLYKTDEGRIVKTFNTRSATSKVMDGFIAENQVTPEQQQTLLDKLEAQLAADIDGYLENRLNEAKDSLETECSKQKQEISEAAKKEKDSIVQNITEESSSNIDKHVSAKLIEATGTIDHVTNASKQSITEATATAKQDISSTAESIKTSTINSVVSESKKSVDTYMESKLKSVDSEIDKYTENSKNDISDSTTEAKRDIENTKDSLKNEITNAANDAKTKAIADINSDEHVQAITKNTADIKNLDIKITDLREYVTGVDQERSWKDVRLAIKTGLHKDIYSVGDLFTSVFKDTNNGNKEYDNPLRINHFQDGLELEDGTLVNGMWLQTKYVQLYGVQFSHQQAFYVSESGMDAGTYCVKFNYTWGSNVKAGDVWNFTLTKAVPAGGKLAGFYGAPNQVYTNWRVYVYSADGKTVLETATVQSGESGTLLGTMTAYGDDTLNGIQQMAYGDNRYATSALRQYLNSDKPKGEWWTAQTKWDIAPDQLNSIDGYLCGFDPEVLAILKPVKVVTYCNTVTKTGIAQVKDVTYDKVMLISLEQMYINPQISGEGEFHEYYKELNGTDTKFQQWQTYEILKTYAIENVTSSHSVRLRSAARGSAFSAWYVNASGTVYDYYASGAFRFAPIMFIGESE